MGWFSRSCRRTLDHPGGAPPSTDDNVPRLFFTRVSASSSPNMILVFSFFFLALPSHCTFALLPTRTACNQYSPCKGWEVIHSSEKPWKTDVHCQKSRIQMMNQWGNGGYLYHNLYDRTAGGVDRKKTTETYYKRVNLTKDLLWTFSTV